MQTLITTHQRQLLLVASLKASCPLVTMLPPPREGATKTLLPSGHVFQPFPPLGLRFIPSATSVQVRLCRSLLTQPSFALRVIGK